MHIHVRRMNNSNTDTGLLHWHVACRMWVWFCARQQAKRVAGNTSDHPASVSHVIGPSRTYVAFLNSVSQAAMTHVLAGVQLGLRGRPDAAWFAQQEQEALEEVQQLLPK